MWTCLRAIRCPHRLRSYQLQLNDREVAVTRRHISQFDGEAPEPTSDPLLDNRLSINEIDCGEGHYGPGIPPTKHKLPLSPLMDPKLIAARERHRTPKAAPSPDRSAFSQKLRNNPYALALASPVRSCNFTGLRLPDYFHLNFGLQYHPATGAPWCLPRIASDHQYSLDRKDISKQTGSDTTDSADQQEPRKSDHSEPSPRGFKPVRTLSSTHFPARASALRFISRLKRREQNKLIPLRWKEDSSLQMDNFVWREDMDEYVLSLLRNNVAHSLRYLGSRTAGYIQRCDGWDYVGKHHQVSAVLWLGDPEPSYKVVPQDPAQDKNADPFEPTAKRDSGPPTYAMVQYRGRYIPSYNLPFLLAGKHLGSLKNDCVSMRGSLAVVKQKHATVEVQLALWKLMGYLAPYEEG